MHNRYPENLENGNGNDFVTNTEKDEHGHILRKWGTPVPPGLRPARPMPRVHCDYLLLSLVSVSITVHFLPVIRTIP